MLKFLNKGTVLGAIWLVAIGFLMVFFLYRTQVSDNWREFPSVTSKPWAAAIANATYRPFSFLAYWDSSWYLRIAREGYFYKPDQESDVVFLPAYPLLIRAVNFVTKIPFHFSGAIVSAVFLLVACTLLYNEVKERWDETLAEKTLLYFLLFPTALFLGLVYTESFFLALVLASFWAMRKRKWFWVGVFGFFLALTRVIGLFIIIPAIIEYFQREKKINWKVLWLLLIPIGFGLFMVYLQLKFGNALAFMQGQANFHRLTGLSAFKEMFFLPSDGGGKLIFLFDFACAAAGLAAGIFFLFKKQFSYGAYTVLGILIPLSTATTQSMARYCIVLFPIFIAAALFSRRHSWFHYLFLFLSPLILGVNIVQFVHFAWVG